MGWFNRKPRDLIADANAEWDAIRTAEYRQHRDLDGMIATDDLDAHQRESLIASGGWCAPSEASYDFFSLPEMQIKRGGIKFQ